MIEPNVQCLGMTLCLVLHSTCIHVSIVTTNYLEGRHVNIFEKCATMSMSPFLGLPSHRFNHLTDTGVFFFCVCVYMYVCVCVCVCVTKSC